MSAASGPSPIAESPAAPRMHLRLLGRFAATIAGEPPRLLQISGPRHRALLAYLAMHPAYTDTRERVATLLWGDRPDKFARQSLRQCLLILRKEFELAGSNPLVIERDAIGLDPNLVSVDARELLVLAASDSLPKEW